jgi:hypothetical protein
MSFRLFSSDATVCQMYYSLVAALDILVNLISVRWVARLMKSISKLMAWLYLFKLLEFLRGDIGLRLDGVAASSDIFEASQFFNDLA